MAIEIIAKNILLDRKCENCDCYISSPEGFYCISEKRISTNKDYIWDGPEGLKDYWGYANHGIKRYTEIDKLGICQYWICDD